MVPVACGLSMYIYTIAIMLNLCEKTVCKHPLSLYLGRLSAIVFELVCVCVCLIFVHVCLESVGFCNTLTAKSRVFCDCMALLWGIGVRRTRKKWIFRCRNKTTVRNISILFILSLKEPERHVINICVSTHLSWCLAHQCKITQVALAVRVKLWSLRYGSGSCILIWFM